MHESGLVRDIMSRVEQETGEGEQVRALRLRVGVLSGISPEALRQAAVDHAVKTWGYSPKITVEESTDAADPNSIGVVLVSIGLGD